MLEANTGVADEGCVEATAGDNALTMGLGVAVDETVSSVDAQNADGVTDNAGFASVVISPSAVFRVKFSEGAAEDTALAVASAAQVASSDGLTVTGSLLSYAVWGYSGANEGHIRRCSSAGVVTLAFPVNIAANDEFLQANVYPSDHTSFIDLTTNATQADTRTAIDANNFSMYCVELQVNGQRNDGMNNSFGLMLIARHAFNNIPIA